MADTMRAQWLLTAALTLASATGFAQDATPAPATVRQPETAAPAQKPAPADITQNSSNVTTTPTAPRNETPVDGLLRKDEDTITLDLPGGKVLSREVKDQGPLEIRDFDFNGEPVPTDKMHLKPARPRRLRDSPPSPTPSATGASSLARTPPATTASASASTPSNHAHTIVRNSSQDYASAKGSTTYKPIPFFMSTTGYGLWLDTTAEATFDMNVTSRNDIIVDVAAEKLRIVLFTGPQFPDHSQPLHRPRRTRHPPALLGLRPVEVARLPPVAGRGDGRRRQDARARPARLRHPHRLPLGHRLQQLQVQPQTVRRRARHGQTPPRAGLQDGPLAHLLDQLEVRHAQGERASPTRSQPQVRELR